METIFHTEGTEYRGWTVESLTAQLGVELVLVATHAEPGDNDILEYEVRGSETQVDEFLDRWEMRRVLI